MRESAREVGPQDVGGSWNGGAIERLRGVQNPRHRDSRWQSVQGGIGVLFDFDDGPRLWWVGIVVVIWKVVEIIIFDTATGLVGPLVVEGDFAILHRLG